LSFIHITTITGKFLWSKWENMRRWQSVANIEQSTALITQSALQRLKSHSNHGNFQLVIHCLLEAGENPALCRNGMSFAQESSDSSPI